MNKRIAIVGAGLVGSLWAVYMARKGYSVKLFDRRPDIRKMRVVQGKSINLALSDRGWRALKGAGIYDEIRKVALPMTGRLMHALDGTLTYQPYGKEGQAIYSVSRGVLNQTLLDCADKYDNVELAFNLRCTDVDLDNTTLHFHDEINHQEVTERFDHIFGTDGAFSAVRTRMTKLDRFDYSQTYLDHGYKELEIPANEDGSHRMRKDCLHIWPRGEFMMIALPNLDGSFTCTLFIPFEGKNSLENLKTPEAVTAFFNKHFPDAVGMMPELTEDFFANPNASLVMTKCYPWNYQDTVCLLGDAAHAIVPFYGQGMNAGFEDCTVMSQMMDEYNHDFAKIFPTFTKVRKPAGDAILELALRNYIEMRDLTADPVFLLQKKIEARFSSKYPDKWIPLYSQVTFSHIPYQEALANGDKQQRIMDKIMALPDIESKWDSDEVEQLILQQL
ncbi:MAG TPA: NAD(P)/FAD-dependent oxidoreductase [Flavobacteriales bacterium]